jgi:gluconate 5-dehydrogenase
MTRTITSLFDLHGKVAVVTGGAGWLGAAISETLHELGAVVFVASRSQDKSQLLIDRLNAHGESRAKWIALDIADEGSIKSCLEQVVASSGRIDVLVNNAYSGSVAALKDTTLEMFENNINSGLCSPFACLREAAVRMKESGGGSIINIASMYGMVSPDQRIYEGTQFQSSPAYGAAKAGLIQFTRYAACELGQSNIRVNAISPGPFPGPETQKNQQFMTALSSKNPLGRIGEPWELKGAIALLASDASTYITGQNIAVDGGWTAW